MEKGLVICIGNQSTTIQQRQDCFKLIINESEIKEFGKESNKTIIPKSGFLVGSIMVRIYFISQPDSKLLKSNTIFYIWNSANENKIKI